MTTRVCDNCGESYDGVGVGLKVVVNGDVWRFCSQECLDECAAEGSLDPEGTSETRPQDTTWYQTRPAAIQARIDQYPPNRLYRLKPTGHAVYLISYGENEDGSCTECTVAVTRKYNPHLLFERNVFGISFDDLEDLGGYDWQPQSGDSALDAR